MKDKYVMITVEDYKNLIMNKPSEKDENTCVQLVGIILENIEHIGMDRKYSSDYLLDGLGIKPEKYVKDIVQDILRMLKYANPARYSQILEHCAEEAEKG